ncbi:hypothetical protein MNBD_GAMMA19-453 [hydrothermal vent metagenome]|uniref:Uncharacterized protein n=1 Tax=hydrothermal vent metagenome TaxID=652676 RepID=A0A3B1ARZ6_9ZZZZ
MYPVFLSFLSVYRLIQSCMHDFGPLMFHFRHCWSLSHFFGFTGLNKRQAAMRGLG